MTDYTNLIDTLRQMADKSAGLLMLTGWQDSDGLPKLYREAAEAIEELSKRINGVTAERDAAMKRLCEWCGVGCSMENRRAELCEIAAVGLEFLESPKEET